MSKPRFLITAFEPFGRFTQNSSQLTCEAIADIEFTDASIDTRLYPVDFSLIRDLLEQDLLNEYDYVIHLGQSAKASCVEIELYGRNVGIDPTYPIETFVLNPLSDYLMNSSLPAEEITSHVKANGHAIALSENAGTYLCNATLYWSLSLITQHQLKTKSAFFHLPLTDSQSSDFDDSTHFVSLSEMVKILQTSIAFLSASHSSDGNQ